MEEEESRSMVATLKVTNYKVLILGVDISLIYFILNENLKYLHEHNSACGELVLL